MSKSFKKSATVVDKVDYDNTVGWEVDPEVTVVIDMDEQVFITAAACEERFVEVSNNFTESSGLFKNRTEFKRFMSGIDHDPDTFEIEDVQKPEKVSFAINTLKNRINNILKKCKCSPDNAELYIDGGTNFRLGLPLAAEYKGNRKNTLRPVLLKELKDYCIDYMDTEQVKGLETDDVVCIRVSEGYRKKEKVIGVTQDKDSRQVEGLWFNYEKESKPHLVKGFGSLWIDTKLKNDSVKGEGWKFLYYQLIYADDADNYCSRDMYPRVLINGALDEKRKKPRWGMKTAYKALQECNNHKQCLELIVKKYKDWYGTDEFEYMDYTGKVHKATWLDALHLQFQLAYMKRTWTDKNCIKKILKKMGMLDE